MAWKLFEMPEYPKRAYGRRGRVIAPGHPVHLLYPNSKTGENIYARIVVPLPERLSPARSLRPRVYKLW
jgi:hypothetical protein